MTLHILPHTCFKDKHILPFENKYFSRIIYFTYERLHKSMIAACAVTRGQSCIFWETLNSCKCDLKICGDGILIQLLCFWISSIIPFLFKTHNVSKIGFVSVFRWNLLSWPRNMLERSEGLADWTRFSGQCFLWTTERHVWGFLMPRMVRVWIK
jgi:hypothetical protein